MRYRLWTEPHQRIRESNVLLGAVSSSSTTNENRVLNTLVTIHRMHTMNYVRWKFMVSGTDLWLQFCEVCVLKYHLIMCILMLKTYYFCMLGCSRQGFYGDNCTLRCPSNCRETQCNLITGHCTSCVPGYYGFSCNRGMHVLFTIQIKVLKVL